MKHNEYLISPDQAAQDAGYEDVVDLLESVIMDSLCPACCKDGCEVEHDGTCEHGCPSVMLELGII